MQYVCKTKVYDSSEDNIFPRFDICLDYKKKNRIFYKRINIYSLKFSDVNCDQDKFNAKLLKDLKDINSMSEDQWQEYIRHAITLAENKDLKEEFQKHFIDAEKDVLTARRNNFNMEVSI